MSAVVESHPDNALPDLRLDRPFPGLVEYVDALDLHTMTKQVTVVSLAQRFFYYINSHNTLRVKQFSKFDHFPKISGDVPKC